MLTKETDQEFRQKRTITVPFYLAVSVVLLIIAMLTAGSLVLSTTNNLEKSPREILNQWTSNNGWNASKGVRIRTALTKLPARYVASLGQEPELPKLVIDIKFQYQEQLRAKREVALQRGMLIQEANDLVPAEVRTGDRTVKVRLRLKGDQSDHFDSDKWSMRIEVRGDDHILGMRRFSLQHPKVRSYHAEPVFMETLRHVGVLGVRYQFVHLIVNGEDKGIMALEEHFSKELLEHQARREGVFTRFDETNFWDYQRAGGQWRGSPYDNYRISRISTFRAKKIAETPALSAQYQTAVGLMRSFSAGDVQASEVFDVEATASYLAALELWGSWHSIQWNDIRFYFDPITMKLEPVGYDANLQLQSDLREVTLMREPIYAAFLQDPEIRASYFVKLRQLCNDVIDGSLGVKLDEIQKQHLSALRHEFLLLEPMDLDNLVDRAEFLLLLADTELLADPVTYPRRIRFPALVQANVIQGQDGPYLEIANMLAEPVTVTAIEWQSPDSVVSSALVTDGNIEIPFVLQPTLHGEVPKYDRLALSEQQGASSENLVITVTYPSWPHEKQIRPVSYLPEVGVGPVPKSSIAELLSRHPYIAADESSTTLTIEAGLWTVTDDLIIPAGFTLAAGPGTELQFAEDAALISYGALSFLGSERNPVSLRGIDSGNWQGLAVMQAQNESTLRHVAIRDTSGVGRGAWQLTGGVSFYRSDVVMEDVSIDGHIGEDALNVIRAHFDISRLQVSDTYSDGFDADFTTGTIRDSYFTDVGAGTGGDAIDISGSDVTVEQIRFQGIADKAFSVGEGSRARASGLSMNSVGTAIASKDGSHLDVDGVSVDSVIFAGLMAYTKKPEYGPASIKAQNIDFKPTGPVGRVQTGSSIELDGKEIAAEDLDVDLLYETVMRKGT